LIFRKGLWGKGVEEKLNNLKVMAGNNLIIGSHIYLL
jgi:hypothetical protein